MVSLLSKNYQYEIRLHFRWKKQCAEEIPHKQIFHYSTGLCWCYIHLAFMFNQNHPIFSAHFQMLQMKLYKKFFRVNNTSGGKIHSKNILNLYTEN